MAKHNGGFMIQIDKETHLLEKDVELHNPEHVANALLRQAVENARHEGTPIWKALTETVGLPMSFVIAAKHMDFHHLETLRRYLREGRLKRGFSLAEVEMLIKIKRYVSEELMTAPTEEESRNLRFQTAIETGVARKAHRPQRSINSNFTPEKGSWDAPDYDGKDEENNMQSNLWVFPTRICIWQGKNKPTPTIVRVSDLERLYRKKMREGDASEMPIRQLRYEVKDWLRRWKPTVQEIFTIPDKKRRNAIENQKIKEIQRLRNAVKMLASDNRSDHKAFWRMAFQYLGRLARVEIKDQSLEKRIENQIRRKANARKYRIEGRAFLPKIAAGDLLLEPLEKKVAMIRGKNAHLNNHYPWVIEVIFDSALREDKNGHLESPTINWAMALRHENSSK